MFAEKQMDPRVLVCGSGVRIRAVDLLQSTAWIFILAMDSSDLQSAEMKSRPLKTHPTA